MARLLYSVAMNEARMAAMAALISNPIMRMFGLQGGDSVPVTCEQPDSGFLIAEGSESAALWMGAPSTTKPALFVARANIWSSWALDILSDGTIAYVRIYDDTGSTCHMQMEVKDVSELLPPAGGTDPDPETGVWGGEKFEPGYLYVDGKVITSQQVGGLLTLDEMSFTAGNQARFVDV